jgi:hypothetical protein
MEIEKPNGGAEYIVMQLLIGVSMHTSSQLFGVNQVGIASSRV